MKIKIFLIFTFLFLVSIANAQDWTASRASGRFASVTNSSTFLGKGSGTFQAPLQLNANEDIDTTIWKPIIVGSEYRMLVNKSTYLGQPAGTVYAVLVYDLNSVSMASISALIGDTATIVHTNQNETITGNYTHTGSVDYKTLLSSPVTITNDTVFASTGSVFTKTLSANTSIKLSDLGDGQIITVAITNTASNYTLSWSALGGLTLKWSGNAAPTQTTGAKTDVYSFQRIGNYIYSAVIQNF